MANFESVGNTLIFYDLIMELMERFRSCENSYDCLTLLQRTDTGNEIIRYLTEFKVRMNETSNTSDSNT